MVGISIFNNIGVLMSFHIIIREADERSCARVVQGDLVWKLTNLAETEF